MEHKDIDRLFQEKLKDVEVTPNPKVWNAIEQKLQKKKRRVLPIWWFSGVASLLLLSLFFWSKFSTDKQQQNNNFPVITNEAIKKDAVTNEDIENNETLNKQEKNIDVSVAKQNFEEKKKKKGNKTIKIDTNKKKEESRIEIAIKKNQIELEEDILKGNPSSNKIAVKNDFEATQNVEKSFEKDLNLVDEKIAKRKGDNNSEEEIKKGFSSSDVIVLNDDLNTQKKEGPQKKDFIAEIAKEKEVLENNTEELEKWTVSPVVGVLKSNSFSQASALDADFNNNDFSGENTLAYGINVSYQLNDKWALKSGIQLQKTSFTTQDVTLVPSSAILVANSIENVSYNTGNSSSDQDFVTIDDLILDSQQDIATEQGTIQQNYSYIEIPMELKYTFLSSKKITTSIISGFSSLILNENSIVGKSSSFNGDIGGATNLNTINFSGNLGLDFDVQLSKKINLNINPMFKTQLNTFSKNSNGFKPYHIGIYTGIKYSF